MYIWSHDICHATASRWCHICQNVSPIHQLYTDGNRVNSGRGKSLTAGAIQRSCGDNWSLSFDRRKTSLPFLRSSRLKLPRTLSRRSWRAFVRRLRRPHPRLSTNRHKPPVSISSRSLIPPRYDVSFATQRANLANLTQFHPGSSKRLRTNFCLSLPHFSTHRWAAALSQHLKRPLPSPQFPRRRLSYDLSNYRPISNLTFLSKLLERAAYEQIVGYLDRFQLLPELQSAYRNYRSTETATIKVMSDVYEAEDAGSVALLGLLDLSAAFDTVDHRILQDRLAHDYGIRGVVIQWIESYLTRRSQFVRYNGVTSNTVPITSGVPQGSVSILFISYSAEVVAIVQHLGFKVHAFADDLQIYGSTAQNGAADLMARMSICIECVASWMSSNRLRLNLSKLS